MCGLKHSFCCITNMGKATRKKDSDFKQVFSTIFGEKVFLHKLYPNKFIKIFSSPTIKQWLRLCLGVECHEQFKELEKKNESYHFL